MEGHWFITLRAANKTCLSKFEFEGFDYLNCMCSGLSPKEEGGAKTWFCVKLDELGGTASVNVGVIIGALVGCLSLVVLALIVCRLFNNQCAKLLFCCHCCDGNTPDLGPMSAAPNQNSSNMPRSRLGKFFYSQPFLAAVEFVCDCDCVRPKRSPKHSKSFSDNCKPKAEQSDEQLVALQQLPSVPEQLPHKEPQLKRMRSVRKAPPPPPVAVQPQRCSESVSIAPVRPWVVVPPFGPSCEAAVFPSRRSSGSRRMSTPIRPTVPAPPPPTVTNPAPVAAQATGGLSDLHHILSHRQQQQHHTSIESDL